MNLNLFYPLFLSLPIGFLAVILAIWKRFDAFKGLRIPIKESEKFLRSPGSSALQKVESLNEELNDVLISIIGLPAFIIVGYLGLKSSGKPVLPHLGEATCGIITIGVGALAAQMISKINERNRWRLGFRGERAVGEYLNKLMLDGCRVFHDFPLYGKGNLDHIIVAPSGVYAIETKAKRQSSRDKKGDTIEYNGNELIYPSGKRYTDSLEQAERQAKKLNKEIYHQLGLRIWVHPILVLPGWKIIRTGRSNVNVLKHTELASAIIGNKTILSSDQIQKIAAYLDRECRDVAF